MSSKNTAPTLKISLLIFAVTLGSCQKVSLMKQSVSSWFGSDQKPIAAAKNTQGTPALNTSNGSFFKIKRSTLRDQLELRGSLRASERVEVRSDKRVRIGPAQVKLYATVKTGQLLFEVDTKDLKTKQAETKERLEQVKIDLQASKSQLEFSKKQYERKKSLAKKGIAPQKELDDAEKQYDQAKTAIQTKELDLRKNEREYATASSTVTTANIVAPIDGIVSTVVNGGDEINQGQLLATISNPAKLSLFVELDETVVTKMQPGFEVEIRLDAFPEKTFPGTIKSSQASATSQGLLKTYETRIDIDANQTKSLSIRDGYEGTMIATFGKRDLTLTVPIGAIKQSGPDSYLLIAASMGGSVSARPVKTGLKTVSEIEIIEGAKEDELVFAAIKEEKKL